MPKYIVRHPACQHMLHISHLDRKTENIQLDALFNAILSLIATINEYPIIVHFHAYTATSMTPHASIPTYLSANILKRPPQSRSGASKLRHIILELFPNQCPWKRNTIEANIRNIGELVYWRSPFHKSKDLQRPSQMYLHNFCKYSTR